MSNKIRFTPNLKILMLAAVLLPLMICLGFWQLDRAAEKMQLLQTQLNLHEQPARYLHELDKTELQRYRALKLNGYFNNEHNFLLDNRVRNGKVGYEVLTPFVDTKSNTTLLVNRGWIAAPAYRNQLPIIPPVLNESTVLGELYRPFKLPTVYASAEGWPKVIQSLDTYQLQVLLGVELADFSLRLRGDSAGALQVGWMVVNVQPEKHTAYAVQWFAMALALLILVFFTNINNDAAKKQH